MDHLSSISTDRHKKRKGSLKTESSLRRRRRSPMERATMTAAALSERQSVCNEQVSGSSHHITRYHLLDKDDDENDDDDDDDQMEHDDDDDDDDDDNALPTSTSPELTFQAESSKKEHRSSDPTLLPTFAPAAASDSNDGLVICCRHLISMDPSPLSPLTTLTELDAISQRNLQAIVDKIFQLPITKTTGDGEGVFTVSVESQPALVKLPRQMPIPKQVAKTRWQVFAEAKGIQKQKRGRKVWDDSLHDWVPRYGYKSVKKNAEKIGNPVIEVKSGEDPYEDPFEKNAKERQLVKAKQNLRELRNVYESKGKGLPTGVANLGPDVHSRKVGKAALQELMSRAKVSTASYGRHDKAITNDVSKRKKPSAKSVSKPLSQERLDCLQILSQLKRRKEAATELKKC